jgi:hypothetical protein
VALELIGSLIVVLVLIDAWATRAVLRDQLSSSGQRTAQVAFVWLVPVVGALLALYLKRREPEAPFGRYREEPDPGDDFTMSRQSYRNIEETIEDGGSSSREGASSD